MRHKAIFGISYLDPPKGKTKELMDQLIQQKEWGKNEGGDEIIAVVELLSNLERNPYLNSLVLKNSPIWALTKEFAEAFFPHPPEKSELLEHLATKHQWEDLPIYVIGFSNATNALTASLQAHGVQGKEVITTSYNYAAAPNAIVAAGAIPRFVDIDLQTFSIDIASALKAVNPNTGAILLTHVNQGIDLLPLIQGLEKKKRDDIAIFQDGTAAIGSVYQGLGVGQINPPPHGATVFSLGPTKVISGLGGALVVAHDFDFLRKVESLSFYGFNPLNDEEILAFGNNYKMNEISAVIALEQLKKRGPWIEKRKKLREMYDAALAPLVKKKKLALQKLAEGSVITHYMVRLNQNYHAVIRELALQHKVGVSHWYSYHLESLYRLKFGTSPLPVTEALASKIIFLPFHVDLEEGDVLTIARSLEAILGKP